MKETRQGILALKQIKRWLWNNSKRQRITHRKHIDTIVIDRDTFDMLFDESIKQLSKRLDAEIKT